MRHLKLVGKILHVDARGLCVGGNPTMLDLMDLSAEIWNDDAKYAYKKTMQNCWIKAGILPRG